MKNIIMIDLFCPYCPALQRSTLYNMVEDDLYGATVMPLGLVQTFNVIGINLFLEKVGSLLTKPNLMDLKKKFFPGEKDGFQRWNVNNGWPTPLVCNLS